MRKEKAFVIVIFLVSIFFFLGIAQAKKPDNPVPPQDDLQTQIDQLRVDLTAAQNEISNLQTDLSTAQSEISTLRTDLTTAQSTISSLQAELSIAQTEISVAQDEISLISTNPALLLGPYVSIEEIELNNLTGPHLIFTGLNIHVRSGYGNTPECDGLLNECPPVTGLGNLIIGYNEISELEPNPPRSGSHNLIVGPGHTYMATGGFVAGFTNFIGANYASVSGGEHNGASAQCSSVSGGEDNNAYGGNSSVSGGNHNDAVGFNSSVSGGVFNRAIGDVSSVSGGEERSAPNDFNWAAGNFLEAN